MHLLHLPARGRGGSADADAVGSCEHLVGDLVGVGDEIGARVDAATFLEESLAIAALLAADE